MVGETDLARLLRGMEPKLLPTPYLFVALAAGERLPGDVTPFATIAEEEGLTLVLLATDGTAAGDGDPLWARISLTIHSGLAAIGLTAAFAGALAVQGISANVIAGFYHDHIFVPWERRHDAMAALLSLAKGDADV